MPPNIETRPEWLPDEYEHVELTREEVWRALDQEARRLFNLTADEFLRIFQDPPDRYHGDPVFNSLCFLADLIAEPSELQWRQLSKRGLSGCPMNTNVWS